MIIFANDENEDFRAFPTDFDDGRMICRSKKREENLPKRNNFLKSENFL